QAVRPRGMAARRVMPAVPAVVDQSMEESLRPDRGLSRIVADARRLARRDAGTLAAEATVQPVGRVLEARERRLQGEPEFRHGGADLLLHLGPVAGPGTADLAVVGLVEHDHARTRRPQ